MLLRDYDMKVGNIKLEREIGPAIFRQSSEIRHQLEQVFLNIVNNGMDAMAGDEGHRRIRATAVQSTRVTAKDNWVTN